MRDSVDRSVAHEVIVDCFRLLSLDATAAPAGDASADWFVYRIGQGKNIVTGYRRGTRTTVTVDVERIVDALNERLLAKGRPYR